MPAETSSAPRMHIADILILLVALVLPTVVTWIYFVALAKAPASVQQSAYAVGKVIQFALPVIWLVAAHRNNWLDGWTFHPKGLAFGIVFGVIVAGLMVALYHLWLKPVGFFDGPAEEVRAKVSGLGIDAAWKFAALGLFYCLMHSFLEEYYWRWFVFRQLDLQTPVTFAITVSSLGFMAHHVILLAQYFGWASPATWLFSIGVAIGGAVWAGLYWYSGSLLGPWISHLLIDAAIFIIGYDLVKETFR